MNTTPETGSDKQQFAASTTRSGKNGVNGRTSASSTPSPEHVKRGTPNQVKKAAPATQKRQRTKSGCWTCRRRKIKCDEQHPVCRRCQVGHLTCEGYGIKRPTERNLAKAARSGSATPVSAAATSPAGSERLGRPATRTQRPTVFRTYSEDATASRNPGTAYPAPSPTHASAGNLINSAPPSSFGGDYHGRDYHSLSTPASSRDSSVSSIESLHRDEQAVNSPHHRMAVALPYAEINKSSWPRPPGLNFDPSRTQPHHVRFASNSGPLSAPLFGSFNVPATAEYPGLPHIPLLTLNQACGMESVVEGLPDADVRMMDFNQQLDTPSSAPAPSTPMTLVTHPTPIAVPTPVDFDSLFSFANPSKNIPVNASAPYPNNYWDDEAFVDKMLRSFANANSPLPPGNFAGANVNTVNGNVAEQTQAQAMPPAFNITPDTGSSTISPLSDLSLTLPLPPQLHQVLQGPLMADSLPPSASMPIDNASCNSVKMEAGARTPPSVFNTLSSSSPTSLGVSHPQKPALPAPAAPAPSFTAQPAIDPLLAASCNSELHKRNLLRLGKSSISPYVPTLEELDLGPPPIHPGSERDWSIPAKMREQMKTMENKRHVELLRHYFISTCPLFNTVDHPNNPFRTFVAEHAAESMPLLFAILAVATINQSPLSVEARAESLLYFESSVDYYVRSLEQQDDISLFTLLFLSLYYAFDAGTQQSQHFSRRAQSIINDRFERLGQNILQANPDFKFLVRLHVWYEVMANLARRPGDLRDLSPGIYTLGVLIDIIEQWDMQEERLAGLSSVTENYVNLGLQGVPTFFIALLNDISILKEEQVALLSSDVQSLDEVTNAARQALISKHSRKIRDLECKIQFARPGRLVLPPVVANEAQIHRAVSVRFFDLFRLAASIHLLTELQGMAPNDSPVQMRITEMVNLLSNIEQNSNYNISGIWAFFVAGAAAVNHADRSVLHRRLDSTWHAPCGNVWSLRSVLEECWERNEDALQAGDCAQSWKDIALSRGWTLLLM